MRTIKFRAWHKKEKVMWKPRLIEVGKEKIAVYSCPIEGNVPHYPKECELMQFTGLQDKNGKDIYCGDIVKLKENEYYFERSGEVIFEEGTFKIKNVELWNDGTYNHYSLEILDTEFCEIIGNIHENKELITNK